jgi:hypothetical protein
VLGALDPAAAPKLVEHVRAALAGLPAGASQPVDQDGKED